MPALPDRRPGRPGARPARGGADESYEIQVPGRPQTVVPVTLPTGRNP